MPGRLVLLVTESGIESSMSQRGSMAGAPRAARGVGVVATPFVTVEVADGSVVAGEDGEASILERKRSGDDGEAEYCH